MTCRAPGRARPTQKDLFSIVGAIEHTLTRRRGLALPQARGDPWSGPSGPPWFSGPSCPPSWAGPAGNLEVAVHPLAEPSASRLVPGELPADARGRLEPRDVVRFLFFDLHAPRSLRHGVGVVAGHLSGRARPAAQPRPARAVGKLLARLTYESDDLWVRARWRPSWTTSSTNWARPTRPWPRPTSPPEGGAPACSWRSSRSCRSATTPTSASRSWRYASSRRPRPPDPSAFVLAVGPPTRVFRYRDWNDNTAHHFTITRFHDTIEVLSRSLVSTHPALPPLRPGDRPLALRNLPYHLRDSCHSGARSS